MHRRTALATAILSLVALTGCASGAGAAGAPSPTVVVDASPSPTVTDAVDAAAQQQAQEWLDAAMLPPGAVPTSGATPRYGSYQGWPCVPVVELRAYWSIPGATVVETANWLRENPTADLVSTAVGPLPEDTLTDSTSIGYIPADGSQQGVVYTVQKTYDGVAVRAQVAALTESAVCPSLPPGGVLGKPGQG